MASFCSPRPAVTGSGGSTSAIPGCAKSTNCTQASASESSAGPMRAVYGLDPLCRHPATMTAIPSDKLDKVVQRWEEIQADLNRGINPATYAQLTKEFADLNPIVETVQHLRKLEAERDDLIQIIDDPASDGGLKEMAQEELDQVGQRVQQV